MARREIELEPPSAEPPEPIERPRRSRSLPMALLVEARPKQWAKNVLVLAAPGAAGILDNRAALLDSLVAFACFCLAAAGTYYLNDAADADADRLHPTKRFRPIAAGEIPITMARVLGVVYITGAVALGFSVRWQLSVVVGAYVALTTCYTLWLKHIAVYDVVGVAAGFVLRAIAGGSATNVPISNWFFIVASFGSLFMVIGKRRAEARTIGDGAAEVRSTLGEYSPAYLAYLQAVTTGVVLVGYCLWAFEKAGFSDSRVPWFQLSILPFVLAILRYALLVDAGGGGAPEDLVFRDRSLQVTGLCWAALFACGVYLK